MKQDKQEELRSELYLKKRAIEEEQDELMRLRDRQISDIEEVAQDSRYYLNKLNADDEFLMRGLRELERMKDNITETAATKFKQLTSKAEAVEADYYQQMRTLSENQALEEEL